MKCRHCRYYKRSRPKGLCWNCSQSPEIRVLYPSTSKHARRGVADFNGTAPPPARPTRARQGTAEKVAVLAQRAEAGTALWHPHDGEDLR